MTVRRLISLSTLIVFALLAVLVVVVWAGTRQAKQSSHHENAVELPVLTAMLELRFDVVQIQQYLTDVSATGDVDGFKAAQAAFDEANADLDQVARIKPELAGDVASIKVALGKYNVLGIEMANAYVQKGREAGNALMKRPNDGFDALAETLTQRLEVLEKKVRDDMSASAERAESDLLSAQVTALILGVIVAVFVLVSGVAVYRLLLRTLGCEPGYAAEVAHRIAEGDLRQNLVIGAGMNGSLLSAIRDMQEALRSLISQIKTTTAEVHSSAHALSSSAQQVSSAAAIQSDKSATMAAAVEEIAVSIAHIGDNAGSAHRNANQAHQSTTLGAGVVEVAVEEMDTIARSVAHSVESVKALGDHSEEISRIVDVIREIADQTNLLALNAAIEAARAGEQGRGFAVVADEVRKLAERTAQATMEIKTTVDSVRSGTAGAMANMESSSARVTHGVELIRSAGTSMTEIQSGVHSVLGDVDDISSSLREQDMANQSIARNVEEIAQMSEETSAIINNVANSASQLETLAKEMSESVNRFKV